MSDTESDGTRANAAPPAKSPPAKAGVWQAVKRGLIRTEAELSYFKGLTWFGLVSTLLVAYFQNLSAYHNKVATLAQTDTAAATDTFTEATTNLSLALTLQQRLIQDFYAALNNNAYQDDTSYLTKDARSVNKEYLDIYATLHKNYNLLARKAEIYLDWATDRSRAEATDISPSTDPISVTLLGEYDFDCSNDMPAFTPGDSVTVLNDKNNPKNPPLRIDWYSTQHHVLTIEYCFDVTHKKMTAALEWASKSPIEATELAYMQKPDKATLFKVDRPTTQVLRLNAFMSLAMSRIEQICIKYRPNGFLCSLPGVSGLLGLFDRCTPIQTKGLLG